MSKLPEGYEGWVRISKEKGSVIEPLVVYAEGELVGFAPAADWLAEGWTIEPVVVLTLDEWQAKDDYTHDLMMALINTGFTTDGKGHWTHAQQTQQ